MANTKHSNKVKKQGHLDNIHYAIANTHQDTLAVPALRVGKVRSRLGPQGLEGPQIP